MCESEISKHMICMYDNCQVFDASEISGMLSTMFDCKMGVSMYLVIIIMSIMTYRSDLSFVVSGLTNS